MQVSDIAWLPPSACFPKHNKNPIKISPQWDSCFCLTWHGGATGMAADSEIKQILRVAAAAVAQAAAAAAAAAVASERFRSGNN